MRVIAGSHKGRQLMCPPGLDLRPTSGRVKEALFSIIGPRIVGSQFLDLYAGTGAVGIEAISREARRVVFVESHRDSLRLLHANVAHCHGSTDVDIHHCTTEKFFRTGVMHKTIFDIVFADPPYHLDPVSMLLPSLEQSAVIDTATIVLLEHATKHPLPSQVGRLSLISRYQYGDTSLSKFMVLSQQGSYHL